jgi:hypothetical protein
VKRNRLEAVFHGGLLRLVLTGRTDRQLVVPNTDLVVTVGCDQREEFDSAGNPQSRNRFSKGTHDEDA